MSKIYSPEELNSFSKETLVAVILSMQDQLSQLNANMERLIEQIADASNKRYGRSSEKLDVIAGQLELELIFNEAEALTETLYVVEPAEHGLFYKLHPEASSSHPDRRVPAVFHPKEYEGSLQLEDPLNLPHVSLSFSGGRPGSHPLQPAQRHRVFPSGLRLR